MPKIRASSLAEHNQAVWDSVSEALDGLLATRPLADISIADIAAAAGMARNTLYNYAPDKGMLVARAGELAAQRLREHLEAILDQSGSPSERLEHLVDGVVQWIDGGARRHLLAASLFGDADLAVSDRAGTPLVAVMHHVEKVLADGVRSGEFRKLVDIPLAVEMMGAVMRTTIRKMVRGEISAATASSAAAAFLLGALRP